MCKLMAVEAYLPPLVQFCRALTDAMIASLLCGYGLWQLTQRTLRYIIVQSGNTVRRRKPKSKQQHLNLEGKPVPVW